MVKFDQSSRVYVTPDLRHRDKGLAGLCGNFNGRDDDDFKQADNALADNALKFAESWGDGSTCAAPTLVDACAANPDRKSWAQKGMY